MHKSPLKEFKHTALLCEAEIQYKAINVPFNAAKALSLFSSLLCELDERSYPNYKYIAYAYLGELLLFLKKESTDIQTSSRSKVQLPSAFSFIYPIIADTNSIRDIPGPLPWHLRLAYMRVGGFLYKRPDASSYVIPKPAHLGWTRTREVDFGLDPQLKIDLAIKWFKRCAEFKDQRLLHLAATAQVLGVQRYGTQKK